MIDPLNLLGAAVACVGAACMIVAVRSGREVLAISRVDRSPADWSGIALLIVVAMIDLGMIVVGTGIALLDLAIPGRAYV